ncbi:unnamed protein product [Rotaria sp. Silwood1]|nr:unnamed protein product [Rotaria sp. Silwood1]
MSINESWFQVYAIRPTVFAIYEPYQHQENNDHDLFIEAQKDMKYGMICEDYLPKDFDKKSYQIKPFCISKFIYDGDTIDLGNEQKITVIFTPGNKPDSISLLDIQEHLLFVRDIFYPGPIYLYRP